MRKLIFFLILIGFIGFINSDAYSRMGRGPGDMHGHGPGGMFFGDPDIMKEKLGLSDEQVDKIARINFDYRKKLIGIREKIEPKHNKLQRILIKENVNLKEVRTLLEEISSLEVEIRMLRINHRLDIEKVLTADQKNQLRSGKRNRMMHRDVDGRPSRPPKDPLD